MNELDIESDVRDFYQGLSAPSERVDAILDARDLVVAARRWKTVAIASSAVLAAMTLIAIGLYVNTHPNVGGGGSIAENSDRPTTPDSIAFPEQPVMQKEQTPQESETPSTSPQQVIVESPYRLVAFRSHGDGCPHCRATGDVYRELQRSLKRSPLEFDQFDFSSSPEDQTQRLDQLNLAALVEGRLETAFLALTTADGTVLKEFKPSQGALRIAKQVQDALGQ